MWRKGIVYSSFIIFYLTPTLAELNKLKSNEKAFICIMDPVLNYFQSLSLSPGVICLCLANLILVYYLHKSYNFVRGYTPDYHYKNFKIIILT